MKLSDRIYKLAELVSKGSTVADIGTDHAYVPMLLVRNGISPHVIMSDISEDSLAKAKETFRLTRLDADDSDFRIGDGLETIANSEVDVVIIAGLGGHTIVDILDADIEKSKSFDTLILQPRKHSGALRYFLYTNGFDITDELLVKEGKFECEIICCLPSDETERTTEVPQEDISWKYPRLMAASNPELAYSKIKWKISSINKQLNNLRSSDKDMHELIESLQKDMDYLNELITEVK